MRVQVAAERLGMAKLTLVGDMTRLALADAAEDVIAFQAIADTLIVGPINARSVIGPFRENLDCRDRLPDVIG